MKKRILFLDFDGVLNSTSWYERRHAERVKAGALPDLGQPYNERDDLDAENLDALHLILQTIPDLAVVVSSSWRRGRTLQQLRELLKTHVHPSRVVGVTPVAEGGIRHLEIRRWLQDNAQHAGAFAALDDDSFDMTPLGEAFFLVDRVCGLMPARALDVIRYFDAMS